MAFLFIATLGPVQPFIASARRTRDLYVGSTLLSELSKAAADEIAKEEGRENLVFPAPLDKKDLQAGSLLNVANKIVAVVQQPPEQLGTMVREAIRQRLFQVKKDAFNDIKLANDAAAMQQLENLVEYSWVAVPFERVEDYGWARTRAEMVLAARKNTHFFREVTWGGYVEKSSIDGQRECVIPSQEGEDSHARQLYNIYKAGPHEHLSAVDLLKRLAWLDEKREAVPASLPLVLSTSHIAATPFLEHLAAKAEKMSEEDKKEAERRWKEYIGRVKQLASTSIVEYIAKKLKQPHPITGNVDGALLFKERLLDDTVVPDKLAAVNEALGEFFKFTDKHLNGLRPNPYYAILLADGDGMGKVIEAQDNMRQHQELSQALAGFADEVRGIVNDTYRGSLVYAGGDDVMALLPLHTALACAKKLAETFEEALHGISDGKGGPTLSVGITVVHHVSLLQDALELARAAERKAKDYRGAKGHPDKNALALIVKKRGGESNEAVISWLDYEARLDLLVALYCADIIPDGMAYELRTMMERLQPSRQDEADASLQRIVQLEAARILRRKLYFSRERTERLGNAQIEQILLQHLKLSATSEEIMSELKTPQDKARYLLLQQIGVQERSGGGFAVLELQHITSFIDILIVAQTFADALKPTRTKGEAE